jgi:4-aminobutyrate aminotransferase-like enzyme
VERLKDAGVLLSTDGPFHNVIKIKPPLVFSRSNADFLLARLREVLAAAAGLGLADSPIAGQAG